MTGTFLIVGYAISTFVAAVLFFAYKKWLNNNTKDEISPTVFNTGKPIKGGIKHIKIVCE